MDEHRISKRRLIEIAPGLSDRDKAILRTLQRCRYVTTGQIQRLHFTDAPTGMAALRAASRALAKIKGLGLAASLARRVGGVRAGSGANVWHLEAAGEHLLRLLGGAPRPRRHRFEPSPHFLTHTLAVSECFVRITEAGRGRGVEVLALEPEPECWRAYTVAGKAATLRPDLFAVTADGQYEDRWFFELDLATEAPVRIVDKCRAYLHYYKTGAEQKQHGIFPLAVWIVPDAARKESLVTHIRAEFAGLPRIFAVITPDELEPLIRQGVEGNTLC